MAGQPVPELRPDEPVLGLSANVLGQLQRPDPSLDIGSPGVALPVDNIPLIGAPGTLQPEDVSALSVLSPTAAAPVEPAQVADPAVVEQPIAPEVAPIAPPEEVFAPEAASARAELDAGVAPSFVEAQSAVATLSAQEDALNIRGDELQTQLGLERDPAKRRELETQAADNVAAREATGSQLDAARGVRNRDQAVETVRIGDAIAQRKRNSEIELEQELIDMDAQRLVDDEDIARAGDEARSRVAETKERTAAIIERGPQSNFTDTALAMVSEAIKPLATPGGEANYDHVVSRLMAQNEAQHGNEIEAAKLRVEIAGDEIGNIGRRRKEEQLQKSVIREMTIRQLRVNVEREAATTTDEFTAARALTIVDSLKQAEEAEIAKQQVLQAAQAKKDMIDRQKFRKGEADIALTGAKIGTERQKAIKAAAEAAKAARRGSGRAKVATSSLFGAQIQKAIDAGQLDKKDAKLVFQQGVIDPVSGKLTTRANGSFVLAASPKIAAELNAKGTRVLRVNNLVNEAMAIRGAKGWQPTSEWLATDAGKRMDAISTEMLLIGKEVWALGVLSGDDKELLLKVQGGDLTGMKDPRSTLRDMRRRMIAAYNNERKSNALGSQALTFPKVQAAPARSLRDVDTLLNQAPNLQTGDVPSVEARGAAASEKFELLVQKHNGNIRKASEEFTKDTEVTLKRAQAHRSGLTDEFNKELPANWKTLTTAAAKAALARQNLEVSGDATGEQINAAELAESTALRAAENALSPKAKKFRAGMREQATFIDDLTDKAGGELERQAESRKLDEERKVAIERERRLSELPTAGKI